MNYNNTAELSCPSADGDYPHTADLRIAMGFRFNDHLVHGMGPGIYMHTLVSLIMRAWNDEGLKMNSHPPPTTQTQKATAHQMSK